MKTDDTVCARHIYDELLNIQLSDLEWHKIRIEKKWLY
jgi:hypothetical protein